MIAAGLGAGSGGVGSIGASFLLTRTWADFSMNDSGVGHTIDFSLPCVQLSSAAQSPLLRSQPS